MNRLKELREDRDLYQKDLARILQMDQSNYSKYELEKVNIPIDVLKRLADFYSTSIDYLLFRTDERKPYKKSAVVTNEPVIDYTGVYREIQLERQKKKS